MRSLRGIAIGLSACMLLTGCQALTARKYLETPSDGGATVDGASISAVAYRTLNDARAAYVSAERFTVSDDTTTVEFVRDLEDADLTTTIGDLTYGVKFDTEVSMLAFDVTNDSTKELRTALKLAAERAMGVGLSKNHSYVVSEEIVIPSGVTHLDGRGAEVHVDIEGTEDKPRNAFAFAPAASGITFSNMVLELGKTSYTRGIFGDGLKDSSINNVSMNGVNYRGVELVSDSGELKNVQLDHNHINNVLGDKSTKDKVLSIVVDGGEGGSELSVTNNTINGGYHGISLSGVSHSVVRGNTISGNTRNISMQNNCSNNVVEDNKLSESFSAAVHISAGSDNNQVKNNTINSSVSYGQGILEAYDNSNGNSFSGNSVNVKGDIQPNWILYVGADSAGTKFSDNTVEGSASRAVVGVEPTQTNTKETPAVVETPTAPAAPAPAEAPVQEPTPDTGQPTTESNQSADEGGQETTGTETTVAE